jgi:biopolymer transport protein ExbD
MKITVKNKPITTVALISMSDVVFLLLIFLLITSSFISYTGIKVNIPSSENVHTEIQKNITISINENEELFLGEEKIENRNILEERLKIEIENDPEIIIMIQADKNIALKNVIELIDTAKAAGSNKFFIAAQLFNR